MIQQMQRLASLITLPFGQSGQRVMCLSVSLLFSALAILTVEPAWAQETSLKDHDTYQAIDISADRLEVKQQGKTAVFKGAVKIAQGKLRLASEELTVFYALEEGASEPAIMRLDARGGVNLISEDIEVVSEWSIYDVDRRLITFGENVKLTRGENILQGDRLELDLDTGLTKLDGAAGANDGRVKGRFNVPSSGSDSKKKNN